MKPRYLHRRDLLRAGVATTAAAIALPVFGTDAVKPEIITVNGTILSSRPAVESWLHCIGGLRLQSDP